MLKPLTFKRLRSQGYWKPAKMQIIIIYLSQALACFFLMPEVEWDIWDLDSLETCIN